MSVTLYCCEFVYSLTLTKDITRISIVKDDPDFLFSQSCIVYKYEYLYHKYEDWYLQKHKQLEEHTPYALPGKNKIIRVYNKTVSVMAYLKAGMSKPAYLHILSPFQVS